MYDEFDNKENEDRYDPEGTPQQGTSSDPERVEASGQYVQDRKLPLRLRKHTVRS